MSRKIVGVTAFLLLAAAASLVCACGKKGPLYLPDAASTPPASNPASTTTNRHDQKRP